MLIRAEQKNDKAFNWNEVAVLLPGRTNKDCRKRWSKVQAGINKGAWTRVEDERLQKALEKQGAKWALVSKSVRTRNADQCFKRWQHVLGPGCKHEPWTLEEDQKLLAAIEKHGNNWKQIGLSELHGRSSHDIRNRSVALTRRGRNQDPVRITPSSLNDGKENLQQRFISNTQDDSELRLNNQYAEDYFSCMDVDSEVEAPHSSIEERAELEPSSGSDNREISHAIDIAETGEVSSVNSMWRWPDFTTHPVVFDQQQLSMGPNTGNSSNYSHISDASLSTSSYPHSGFETSAALPLHEIDFSDFNNRTTDIAQAFRDHDGRFDDVGAPLSLMLESSQNASRPTTTPVKKGLVTISLKQVDAKIAQDITSSLLKYTDSLVIRLFLE
ncbi:hypothetical protein NX059_009870 [Plenodomus lindquistii]|nr:hypothetical protein NX059_009870 [Plenodomus lindquistii]